MNESKITLENAIGKIKNLIAQNKLVEAHKACLEILRFDPDNIKIIKLKNRIEKEVKKQNIIAIKEDLDNLHPLMEQGKYEELLSHLKQLEPYINQYPPLKAFIIKAQKAYKQSIEGEQKKYFNDKVKEIDKLKKQKKYEKALNIAQQLGRDNIEPLKSKTLVEGLKKLWINDELKKGEQFLQTDKHDDILIWLQKLKQIGGQEKKIEVLIEKIKQRAKLYKRDQKKDFIYTGMEKMKTLLQLKKFDKAALAGEEILEIDPTNSKVRHMFVEATRKEMKMMNKQLLKQMKISHKKMKSELSENKEEFIRF